MTASWSLGLLVEALRGLRGIDLLSAATFICTTGDLSRFESPRMLMGYLGLVPSEHSSGGITKTGNREARRMLIEAAWSCRYPARVAKEKAEILVRLPKNVWDIAWKTQTRFCVDASRCCSSWLQPRQSPCRTTRRALALMPTKPAHSIGVTTSAHGSDG